MSPSRQSTPCPRPRTGTAFDAVGHLHGPHSSEFDAAADAALDALGAGLRAVPRMVLLVTADHGQVAVDPAGVDYLDEVLLGEIGEGDAHAPLRRCVAVSARSRASRASSAVV